MTVTLTDELLPPAVAVIVAVPAFTAVTLPVPVTEATDASDELHVTVLLVAFDGLTDAESCTDLPLASDSAPFDTPEPEIATDDTGTVVEPPPVEPESLAPIRANGTVKLSSSDFSKLLFSCEPAESSWSALSFSVRSYGRESMPDLPIVATSCTPRPLLATVAASVPSSLSGMDIS